MARTVDVFIDDEQLTTLPFPDMGYGTAEVKNGGFSKMLRNTKKAWDLGVDYVDPRSFTSSTMPQRFFEGIDGNNEMDYHRPGVFRTEKDFLVWLLRNNVTVCDLGAGTTAVLYKGHLMKRASGPCWTLAHRHSGETADLDRGREFQANGMGAKSASAAVTRPQTPSQEKEKEAGGREERPKPTQGK